MAWLFFRWRPGLQNLEIFLPLETDLDFQKSRRRLTLSGLITCCVLKNADINSKSTFGHNGANHILRELYYSLDLQRKFSDEHFPKLRISSVNSWFKNTSKMKCPFCKIDEQNSGIILNLTATNMSEQNIQYTHITACYFIYGFFMDICNMFFHVSFLGAVIANVTFERLLSFMNWKIMSF